MAENGNRLPKITLSADESERLTRRLDEMISEAEDFRTSSNWEDLHRQYWQQYLAQPVTETRDWPWENSSNLFLPLTQSMTNAIVSQEFDAMLSSTPKVTGFEVSDYPNAQDLTDFYFEYYFKDVMPLQLWGTDWLLDNTVDGTSAVKVRQNQDWFVRRVESIEPYDIEEKEFIPDALTGQSVEISVPRTRYRRTETSSIERVDQTEVEVSDLERIWVAPGSGPSLQWPETRWYFQEQNLTWEDLVERRRNGYDNIDDELKARLGERDLTDREREIRRKEGVAERAIEPTVRILEFYLRWPLPGRFLKRESRLEIEDVDQPEGDEESIPEEIVATYCQETGRLLLVRPLSRVTPDGKRPHVLMHYRRLPRYFYGQGIPSQLRHLNAALNSQWNQSIDYGTLSVVPWGLYSPAITGLMPELASISPGQMVPCMDPRGVVFPRLQGDPNFWLQANQQVQAWAEKVSNITDYTLGRAPNTPNAPRTRGGQAMMLQQSNIAFGLLVAIHAQSFLEVFRRVHSYHKKYSRPGEVYRVMNKTTGMMQQKSVRAGMFDIDCDFQFVLNPNRQVEQQTKQILFQITMQAMMQAIQAPPLAPSIRTALGDLYLSHGMKNFDQIWPEQMLQMQMQPPQGPPGMPPGPPGAPGQELQALEQAQGAGEPIEEKYGYESAPETSMEEEKVGIS